MIDVQPTLDGPAEADRGVPHTAFKPLAFQRQVPWARRRSRFLVGVLVLQLGVFLTVPAIFGRLPRASAAPMAGTLFLLAGALPLWDAWRVGRSALAKLTTWVIASYVVVAAPFVVAVVTQLGGAAPSHVLWLPAHVIHDMLRVQFALLVVATGYEIVQAKWGD